MIKNKLFIVIAISGAFILMLLLVACDKELIERKTEGFDAQAANNRIGLHYSNCERCQMPWNKCRSGKGVKYNGNRGVSPLCVWCEERTAKDERLKYYREWWINYGTSVEQWEQIEYAVLNN